jgi:superfamily II DNA or RNA helicase
VTFDVGSLVRVRDREWVVLPESADDLLVLRPLGGTDDEITGIYLPLEAVEAADFALPDPGRDLGSHRSCALLRDAVRLGFRSGAGPFRCFGRIAVEPRPYQLVPLLMALRLDPVRLLIADDVGVGKTIEACLIARELHDRGEIRRMAVLCPPHLAEQWQRALAQQFHIDAALVLPGTVTRLERECGPGESLFDRHPHVVVSLDYIKSQRRRHEFLRVCPEFVIVDEAHTCASVGLGRVAQQRHELLRDLARDAERHLVLVTATPHSGKEENFRALLALVDPDLAGLPEDLSGEANRAHRERLARHFVQRRRADLTSYLDDQTPFPEREIAEEHYALTTDYRRLFDRVLAFCRERLSEPGVDGVRRRVRWWSALALLRSLGSSPAAAAATLRNRASSADATTPEEADDVGRRSVLDQDSETAEGIDVVPGGRTEEGDEADESSERGRLLRMAREVEKLAGSLDAKLQRAGELVERLLSDGYAPIVFCRFIPTVEYVADALRKRLGQGVTVEAVTGDLPPEEREQRVAALGARPKRVLVCTDCLSEGINLQDAFDAVMHYDLSWNPTRHEQREGRVDRYGQESPRVRTLTFYGRDNPVDGIVLQVLLRKHKSIHQQLGIIVPVPMDTNIVVEAIFEWLLLRGTSAAEQLQLGFADPLRDEVEVQWNAAVEREKKSRTIFAQRSIKVEEVARELAETRRALGDEGTVETFTTEGLRALGATVSRAEPCDVDLAGTPAALRDAIGEGRFRAAFRGAPRGAIHLGRTHPIVEGLAAHVLEIALDPMLDGPARRCGVVRTRAATERTTLLLLRLRFHIVTRTDVERTLLAEDVALVGFQGAPDAPRFLAPAEFEPLLGATPDANIAPDLARDQLARVLGAFDQLRPHLDRLAHERGEALLDAHRRVRKAAGLRAHTLRVEPHLPPDVLGLFVYLPVVGV